MAAYFYSFKIINKIGHVKVNQQLQLFMKGVKEKENCVINVFQKKLFCTRDGPWPDPTRAYILPAENKRQTRLWYGYFLIRPGDNFFDPKGKKLKKCGFLGEIFRTQTHTKDGWPDSSQKILIRTHHCFVLFIFSTYSLISS